MLILSNNKTNSVILVNQENCHIVDRDSLMEYLIGHPNETHYYASNIQSVNSNELLFNERSGDEKITTSKSDNNEVYYRTAQNQIIIVDDMDGLTFNSSNDIKSKTSIVSRYERLSNKFLKMIEMGYLEELSHDEYLVISQDIKSNKKTEEDIIVRGSVSDFMDDLQDSGAPESGPTRIDL
ncbi:hypothetical protein CMI47_08930 [Candidatus Pacearchaeota archaeon]|nr:hypothetical protein [Candidatus Pacearchaeota archaeon]